jgi:hypothetical protein
MKKSMVIGVVAAVSALSLPMTVTATDDGCATLECVASQSIGVYIGADGAAWSSGSLESLAISSGFYDISVALPGGTYDAASGWTAVDPTNAYGGAYNWFEMKTFQSFQLPHLP